jgi:hypothetical protein
MNRTKDISLIVKEQIIDKLDLSIRITSIITQNNDGATVRLCDYKWLRSGLTVDFGGEFFNVIEVSSNQVILSKIAPSANQLVKWQYGSIQAPFFIYGSKSIAESEWNKEQLNNQSTLLPAIWMPEKTIERPHETDSSLLFDADVRLFVLDTIETIDSTNTQQRQQAVRPLLRLCDAIEQAIYDSFVVDMVGIPRRETLTEFATMKDGDWEEFIWDANLGGIDYRPTISVIKEFECC